jgi:hypothetical protein
LLAAVLLAGGCADSEPATSAGRPASEPSPSATAPSSEPAPTPSPDPGAAEPTSRPAKRSGGHKIAASQLPAARRDGTWQHLLTAARLPALGEDLPWKVSGTDPEAADPTGACQKTSLVDIGAVHAVRRDFAGPAGSGVAARQIVAKFADRRSARFAEQVLRSWRDDCERRLDYPRKDVGPLEEIATEAGVAGHYALTYGSRRTVAAAGTGIVRNGAWLTIVDITADGDDYPTGWNPARRAARRIAATFG